jgi:hypothetical protein
VGYYFPVIWHALLSIWCLLMALSDLPGRWITKRLSGWLHPYAEATGTWMLGVSQIYVGVCVLSTSVGVMSEGNSRMVEWRLATGWLLCAMGFVNLFLGAFSLLSEQVGGLIGGCRAGSVAVCAQHSVLPLGVEADGEQVRIWRGQNADPFDRSDELRGQNKVCRWLARPKWCHSRAQERNVGNAFILLHTALQAADWHGADAAVRPRRKRH